MARTGCRRTGWVLIALAVAVGIWDLVGVFMGEAYKPVSAGEIWAAIDLPSLNLVQAVVQRYLVPDLWDDLLLPLLLMPLWQLLAIVGLVLALLCRRRGQPWFRRGS